MTGFRVLIFILLLLGGVPARGQEVSMARSLGIDTALWLAVYATEEHWEHSEGVKDFPTSGFDEYTRRKLHGDYATREYNPTEGRWRMYSDSAIATLVLGSAATPFQDSAKASSQILQVSRVFAVNNFATSFLKNAVHRSRPKPTRFDDVPQGGDSAKSFPSGHASNAFAAATTIVALSPNMPLAGQVATYGLASSVALARLMADRHYATDVVAGALLGHLVARLTLRDSENDSDEKNVKFLSGMTAIGIKYSF